jgi:Tol biopolymer transport system component
MLTRLLSEKTDYAAMTVWAPDGSGVYFARYGTHDCEMWFQPIDGGAPHRLVTQRGTWSSPVSVSADGRYLAYFSYDTETQGRIWYLDLDTDASSPVPRELSVEFGLWPTIAPDGRWIVFCSWSDEIKGLFVRRFPDGTQEQRVAPESAREAGWSADGRELFYRTIDDDGTSTIKVVSVTTDTDLRLGTPRELFRGKFQKSADSGLSFAIFPDGESVLLVPEDRPFDKTSELIVVQNWLREVEAIARSR